MDNNRSITIYTDGSSLGNPGPAGWAVIIDGRQYSGGIDTATNNEAEMYAIQKALELVPAHSELTIITDSRLVIGWFAKGWRIRNPKIRATKSTCDTLRDSKTLKVSFEKTKGHSSDQHNNTADMLARGQARAIRSAL